MSTRANMIHIHWHQLISYHSFSNTHTYSHTCTHTHTHIDCSSHTSSLAIIPQIGQEYTHFKDFAPALLPARIILPEILAQPISTSSVHLH